MPILAEIDRHAAAASRAVWRARAIARGLIATARARRSQALPEGEFVRLEGTSATGSFYWIRRDGAEVRSGVSFAEAESLQPKFVEAMERAGTP